MSHNNKKWLSIIPLLLAVILILFVFPGVLHSPENEGLVPEVLPEPVEESFIEEPEIEIVKIVPVVISIPAISVIANVVAMGLDSAGRMATAYNAYDVSWLKYSAIPGGKGNSIIAAHNYWNEVPGTFRDLSLLQIGDMVEFTFDDDSIRRFRTESVNTYLIADVPKSVMEYSGENRVTMITCAGEKISAEDGYQSRTIVILKADSQ